MAYPLEFTPFGWEDSPSETTPLDREDLQEAEERLAEFTTEYEVHWREPVKKVSELYKSPEVEKGDIAFVEEVHEFWYYTGSEWDPVSALYTHTTEAILWSVPGKIAESEVLPGGFRRLATGETQKLYEVETKLKKGKAEIELLVNGTAVKFTGAVTKVKVTTAAAGLALAEPHTFSSKDKIELVVFSVSETPEGFAASAFVEHTSKAA